MGASDEMLILFLERIYTSGLNDEEAENAMKMAVSLVTQKAAAIGAVAVLARRYQDCYDRDQYVGSQFYVLYLQVQKWTAVSGFYGRRCGDFPQRAIYGGLFSS